MDSKIIYLTTESTESTEEKMRFGSKSKLVSSLYQLAISSVFSVSFDSLAPARLALRANLRLLYLKGPAFSIVVNPAGLSKFLKVMTYE